jgi:hypothetical protein
MRLQSPSQSQIDSWLSEAMKGLLMAMTRKLIDPSTISWHAKRTRFTAQCLCEGSFGRGHHQFLLQYFTSLPVSWGVEMEVTPYIFCTWQQSHDNKEPPIAKRHCGVKWKKKLTQDCAKKTLPRGTSIGDWDGWCYTLRRTLMTS